MMDLGFTLTNTGATFTGTAMEATMQAISESMSEQNTVETPNTGFGSGMNALFTVGATATSTVAEVEGEVEGEVETAEQKEIARLTAELERVTAERDDLDARLALAFEMDESTKNQEVLTLKGDIGSSLKLEHANYLENIEVACDEDMFIAYRATIRRMFRTLGRFGIEFA